jgi:DhnA family fructose-bisphosphate aldolase class Ia
MPGEIEPPGRLTGLFARPFILLASLPRNTVDMARAAAEHGADAMKVHLNCAHFASGTRFGNWQAEKEAISAILAAVQVPVGIVPGAEEEMPSDQDLEEILRAGFAFWDLFVHHTPPRYLRLPGLERMVALDEAWNAEMVGDLARLGVQVIEASIVPRSLYRAPLNLRDLTRYAALCRASPLPVVVPTQKAVRPDEVGWLRQAGARGIAVGAVVTGSTPSSLGAAVAAFRREIDRL